MKITYFINIGGNDTEIHPGQYPSILSMGDSIYFDSVQYSISEVQVHINNGTKFDLPYNPITIVRYVLT